MTSPFTVTDRPPEGSISLAAVGRSALVLAGATVIAQVIGFARQLFFAAEVGVSAELDALFIGLAMPMAMLVILTAGVRTAIIPAYARVKRERGAMGARHLVGTVLVWGGLCGAAITLLLWVFADGVVSITGPGLTEAGTSDDAAHYLRLLSPILVIGFVMSMLLAVTQAESMFAVMALVIVVEPFLAFAIMVYFWDTLGLNGFVIGTLAGYGVGFGVLLAATVVRRVVPIPRLRPSGLGLRGLVRHATPLTFSTVVGEANIAVGRAIASLLLAGGVSVLRFGSSLVSVPFAAIRPAYQTALYPALVQASQGADRTELSTTVERVLRYAIVFFVPLAGLTIAVAPVATAIAYDRGSFDSADLLLTAQVVAVSAPLIVTATVQPTLGSALNARLKGTMLLVAAVIDLVVNVLLMFALGYLFGVVGVALSLSIVSVVVVVFQAYQLKRVEPDLSLRTVGQAFVKSSLAILPSVLLFGIPIWAGAIDGDLVQRIVILVVVGVAGLTTYFGIARRLGLQEAGSIVAFGKGSLHRVLRRVIRRV
jgi:putative peptidoglycan lipid II flippase